jgi:hypothetical protein
MENLLGSKLPWLLVIFHIGSDFVAGLDAVLQATLIGQTSHHNMLIRGSQFLIDAARVRHDGSRHEEG